MLGPVLQSGNVEVNKRDTELDVVESTVQEGKPQIKVVNCLLETWKPQRVCRTLEQV